MPTIKDIARTAGVSHGTVSNALNGRGNVSLEKLNRVLEAAEKLGYAYNKSAAGLRSGQKSGMAVILPNLRCQAYTDFFAGFCEAAANEGRHSVQVFVTGSAPGAEGRALRDARNAGVMGTALISCADERNQPSVLDFAGDCRRLLIERASGDLPYLGFDYARAGEALAECALQSKRGKPARAGIMTDLVTASNERAFCEAARARFQAAGVEVFHVQAISRQYATRAFDFCRAGTDAVITSRAEMARCIESAWRAGGKGPIPALFSVTTRRTARANAGVVYEMDYLLLGRRAYEALASDDELPARVLPAEGLRRAKWQSAPKKPRAVRMLTQESPFTNALRLLAPGLERETGIALAITTFPRNELYEAIEVMGETDAYDVIRMDMNWADWYAGRLFTPLSELPLNVPSLLSALADGLDGEYTMSDGVRRLLPLDPSALMLYYRRDLFEDPAICRGYFEKTRRELTVPSTWEDYVRVASYFTRADNPASPTLYGGTVTHTACEFLSSLLPDLADGRVRAFSGAACTDALSRYLAYEKHSYHAPTGQWVDTADAFLAGNCATAILFTNYVERIVANPLSHVAERVGLAPLPGPRSLLGGGVVGVPRASGRKAEACELITRLFQDDTAQLLALLSGCSASKSAYRNQEVLALYPWLPVVSRGFAGGVRRGILAGGASPFNAKAMEGQIIIACRSAADGVITPTDALRSMQSAFERLRPDAGVE